ncbi:MAG: hypothetical protein H6512_14140 [Acidimicrobiia bacterium]|nr:hypothetical protein [Acidimicrobiia bacterium]
MFKAMVGGHVAAAFCLLLLRFLLVVLWFLLLVVCGCVVGSVEGALGVGGVFFATAGMSCSKLWAFVKAACCALSSLR